jgi:hypothetical protein
MAKETAKADEAKKGGTPMVKALKEILKDTPHIRPRGRVIDPKTGKLNFPRR